MLLHTLFICFVTWTTCEVISGCVLACVRLCIVCRYPIGYCSRICLLRVVTYRSITWPPVSHRVSLPPEWTTGRAQGSPSRPRLLPQDLAEGSRRRTCQMGEWQGVPPVSVSSRTSVSLPAGPPLLTAQTSGPSLVPSVPRGPVDIAFLGSVTLKAGVKVPRVSLLQLKRLHLLRRTRVLPGSA